ncbi:SURP and G-patch domain-containing protein 1-like isoform X1 [Diorhabda carinulata]|uniref:SURP and G-patch domain-containing protein 1-like isoform X1 n=1 Tax=Diorhabda carinulata TaxID=1163345 RepID=UPI0025A1A210|nr:SURP and G-patch domain-containing protein 1-like isoform X1 [Diorhabda carinulata]
MAKKVDVNFQSKISRNDRFAQMSQQEKLIEQKKREILAKLDAKEKSNKVDKPNAENTNKQINKSNSESNCGNKEVKNIFSNDGSFLNQFKQLKETKKLDSKFKGFNRSKGRHDKLSSDDRHKLDRRPTRQRSLSPKDRQQPKRSTRFDKTTNFEPKITINTSFSSSLIQTQSQPPPEPPQIQSVNINTQNVTGPPLLKNVLPQQTVTFQNIPDPPIPETVITASPVLLNVPPPQLVLSQVSNPIITTVNLPSNIAPVPPPCLSTVELSSIPPPNPIQIHNIPQPEPLNTLNIPQPAPLQVHNIPTPTTIQLSKIPTPKPLDLLSIPTPCEDGLSNTDFIRNIPPPNKTIPPPSLIQENRILLPQSQTITVPSTQNVLIHGIPSTDTVPTGFSSVTVALPVVVGQVTNNIPSLMAQPILPPPGIVNVNVSCPPPLSLQNFVNRPPPVGFPPPAQAPESNDVNTVFPSGTPEYEAMASLGRMVAECGDTFEDVVRQRKEQDPRLWFLFDKDSEAYKQYREFVDRVKRTTKESETVKPEDKYEPEMVLEDIENSKEEQNKSSGDQSDENSERKRKRKSRWGNKDPNVPPPAVAYTPPIATLPMMPIQPPQSNPVVLSKITRNDPGLIQYAINTYGTSNLSEEDWKKAEDNYKVNLLYLDMVKKKEEAERLKLAGKNKYEYDSDEDTEGGTWEHKAREKEMMNTQLWANELTKQAEGKHHIGDFLPAEELKKFMEKSAKETHVSDYKEFQIREDNIGFKMLQKLGWSEGEGLGSSGMGIVEPINKGPPREHTQGLGLNESEEDEDEYQSYRKRMMLAYRFRPNPLNNPRRPYY